MEDKVGFVVHKNNISRYGLYVETLLGSITHTHTQTHKGAAYNYLMVVSFC